MKHTNKKGEIAKEALIMLVTVVFTSAIVFGLVKTGFVEVSENSGESMLNTEFIPYERSGEVTIKNFRFCDSIASISGCLDTKDIFRIGDEAHFFFEVDTSTFQGDVIIVENYRILGPVGQVLLEVDQKNDYYFTITSPKEKQTVYLRDYFVLEQGDPLGEYTLQLLITNPLLTKEVRLNKKIQVIE